MSLVKTLGNLIFRITFSYFAVAVGFSGDLQLSEPDELHAVPTVIRATHGVTIGADEIFAFGSNIEDYVRMPFHPEAKERAKRFGEYTESQRLKFPKTKYPGEWRGLLADANGRRVLWDASMLQIVDFYTKDLKIIQEMTVPVDLLKPPADRMGEPTKHETENARAQFKTAYKKVFGQKYSGLSPLPAHWLKSKDTTNFIMSTKIEGFPLTVLACKDGDLLNCVMARYCFLEGGPKVPRENVKGVAVGVQDKLILLGNSANNTIQVYKWESCFNVRFLHGLVLPKSLQTLTSIQIDQGERLWVSTNKWENKFDSNLYYWDPIDWKQGLGIRN